MARTEKIVLKRLRASYPKLFERDTMSGKYGCDLLIRKDDPQLDAFKRVCDLVAKDCRDNNPKKAIKMELLTDGAEKAEELSGYFIIKAKTNRNTAVFLNKRKNCLHRAFFTVNRVNHGLAVVNTHRGLKCNRIG